MPMTLLQIHNLAAACAPAVAPRTLTAVVEVESRFEPLAIGVNGRQPRQLLFSVKADAVARAERLIAQGGSVDLGLAQINSKNLAGLGLSVTDAFDPCRNLEAGARLLATNYGQAARSAGDEQAALRTALSLYNTGRSDRGFQNGYVAKVAIAARRLAPMSTDVTEGATKPAPTPKTAQAWDVFAQPQTWASGFVFSSQTPGEDH
jgi:type IV secretion system protein VirB1